MKKALAILLSLVMLCTLSVTAFAEAVAEEAVIVGWDDVKEFTENYDGDFYQIGETNLKIWIPDFFSEIELDESDEEAGIFSYWMADSQDAAVWFTAYEADETLEELRDELLEEHPDAEVFDLNGIEALGIPFEEEDAMCVYFRLDSGYLLGVNFAPISDEDYFTLFSVMIYSIQTTD